MTSAAELHRAMFEAIRTRDYETLRGLFDPEATHTSSDGEPARGPEPVVAEVEGFVAAFPDLAIDIRHQHAPDPTTSVIEYTFRGTHHGPLEDIPPSGKAMAVVACSVLESQDGVIRRESDYFDRLALLEQLGVGA